MYVENIVGKWRNCSREIAPEEQFLRLSTILCYLMLDFYVKRGIRFSLRDKRLFEITEVEITRVDCTCDLILISSGISFFHFISVFNALVILVQHAQT